MKRSFHSYSVEILDKSFLMGDERKFHKTARVEMFDFHGKSIDVREYAFVVKEEVYKDLASGKIINLNNCYIKDFSLTEFREINGLASDAFVEMKEITAINAFVDAGHDVDLSYAHFTGDSVNFINTLFFCHSLNLVHCKFEKGDIDFTNTEFHCKEVNFQYADFNEGQVIFKDVWFRSDMVSFVNSNFSDGKVYFTGCNFDNASVAFQFARFGDGDISFEKVNFSGKKIDFSKVEFGKGKVDFRLTEFGDNDVSFDESEFGTGKLRFRKAKFGSGRVSFELALLNDCDVSMERTEFGAGELTFYKCECKSITFNNAHLNNYVDLRFSKCQYVDLTGSILRDILDLTNEKNQVQIDEVNFSGMRNLGKIFLDWYDNDVKHWIYNQKKSTVKMKSEQFRLLKEEFRSLGQYTDEDKAYLEFKRLELKDRKERALRANKLNAIWVYPIYLLEYLIFDQIGHYATNPMRVLVSMVISFIGITSLYVILIKYGSANIVSSVGDPDHLSLITKSIYHSAITFLTIGYGDYYPSGAIRWISSVEGFVGLFLMSYFTVAFMRKVLR